MYLSYERVMQTFLTFLKWKAGVTSAKLIPSLGRGGCSYDILYIFGFHDRPKSCKTLLLALHIFMEDQMNTKVLDTPNVLNFPLHMYWRS